MSKKSKDSISEKNSGKVSWNKGLVHEDTTIQKDAAHKREKRYASGELTRHIPVLSDESKTKISIGVKAYADNNTDEIKLRAAKSEITKIANNYYVLKRQKAVDSFIEKCKL